LWWYNLAVFLKKSDYVLSLSYYLLFINRKITFVPIRALGVGLRIYSIYRPPLRGLGFVVGNLWLMTGGPFGAGSGRGTAREEGMSNIEQETRNYEGG
jgi:hypothetical protein